MCKGQQGFQNYDSETRGDNYKTISRQAEKMADTMYFSKVARSQIICYDEKGENF